MERDVKRLPGPGDKDVGTYVWDLYEEAVREINRKKMPDRWRKLYSLFRGDRDKGETPAEAFLNINLIQANATRQTASITARDPETEVVSRTGNADAARELDAVETEWWHETSQREYLNTSAYQNEIYAATVEKYLWDRVTEEMRTSVLDIFEFVPAPYPNSPSNLQDLPYLFHRYEMNRAEAAARYYKRKSEIMDIEESEEGDELGRDREEASPALTDETAEALTQDESGGHNIFLRRDSDETSDTVAGGAKDRVFTIECWIKDRRRKTVEIDEIAPFVYQDQSTGETVRENRPTGNKLKVSVPLFPGGIRHIVVVDGGDHGKIVLSDTRHPCVNWNMPWSLLESNEAYLSALATIREEQPYLPLKVAREEARLEVLSRCPLYDEYPFALANSYRDPQSIWGFNAVEQAARIQDEINFLTAKWIRQQKRALGPTLILPKDSGLSISHFNTLPNLVLQPDRSAQGDGIRWMNMPGADPSLPHAIEFLVRIFDRVYQLEDADRGAVPSGVKSGKAIMALQQKGEILLSNKIRAMDHLVRQRGRACIHYLLNFGARYRKVEIDGEPVEVRPVDHLGEQFDFRTTEGSTYADLKGQREQRAFSYYQAGLIDQKAVLEAGGYPKAPEIIERMAEQGLGAVAQALVDAGWPEDPNMAAQAGLPPLQEIMEIVGQTQQGPPNQAGDGPAELLPGPEMEEAPPAGGRLPPEG